jgi:cyclopropane fatty-acyl-phospholipid synthase-like methyltransferase
MAHEHPHDHDRHGAKQPDRFDPARAARLDDPARFAYVPPDAIVALLDIPPGAAVVDFGTGTGTYAIEIARRRPDARIFALDEQPEMLELMEAKPELLALANLAAIEPDDLEALNGTVARVLGLNVLHELGDEALAAIRALLEPSGYLLMIDWNAATERPLGPPAEHVYTPDAAAERLALAGFSVERCASFPYHYVMIAR